METSTESAAPAPAPAEAAPAATTEPATPSPDAKRAKRDAIVARVRAATKASDEQAPAATAAPAPAPAATTTAVPAEPAPAPSPDAALTARLQALEAELNETKTKLTEREKVRAAPTDVEGLLDLMAENPDMTIEKLSELYLARQDNPAHKVLTAAEKRLAAIEAKIAAGEKAEKERAEKVAQDAQREAGRKDMRAILDGDKGRWPRLTRDERNATEAIAEAEGKAGERARELIARGGKFTEDVAKKLVAEALDEIEKDRADRHARYAPPDIPARRTITATAGSTGTVPERKPEAERPKTSAERKAEILARVRRGQPQTT